MVKIGIVGCGKIAKRHLEALRNIREVQVTVFDIDHVAARRRADEFGVGHSRTLEELLNTPGLAAVDVCVPTPWHRDLVLAALQCGQHVFCEKPLCLTLAEALEIRDALQHTDRQLMVGYLYRFYPAFQYVKQLLEEGIIGEPYFALLRVGGRGDAAPWKHRRRDGGGAIMEMMVHKLDLALWFFGNISTARVLYKETFLPERFIDGDAVAADAEDCVIAHLEANGTQIICQSDLVTPSYMNHIEIQAENGSIFSSMLHYMPTRVYCKKPRGGYAGGATTRQFPMVNVFERELAHFVSVLRGECEAINTIDDSVELIRLIEQLRLEPEPARQCY